MRMLLFSLLLLIPLITADDTADLGFDCDEKKCTFTLSIPQSAVSFVDVDLLETEIAGLNQNVTELRAKEELINDDEASFVFDFDYLYEEAQSNLTAMFNLSSSLNETSSAKLNQANEKEEEAKTLNEALKCMVQGDKSPAECGKDVPDSPTTPSPAEPTDDSTGKTDKPTEEPFTGTTTTPEPFTGTTTTEAPFTGTTTTEEPYTGTTVTEPEKSTTTGPTEGTKGTETTVETTDHTSTTDDVTSVTSSTVDTTSPSTSTT